MYSDDSGSLGICSSSARTRSITAVSNISGEYLLTEIDDDETKVIYRLAVDLGVLLPGFVRTQGEKRVIENALEGLKRRVELG